MSRFFVCSDDDPRKEYTVDLSEYEGNGKCDCPHYRYRIEPCMPKTGEHGPPYPIRCKHIRRARDYMLDRILEMISDNESKRFADAFKPESGDR